MQSFLDHPSRRSAGERDEHVSGAALTSDQLGRLASLLHDQLAELHQRLRYSEETLSSLDEDTSVEPIERQAVREAVDQYLESIRAANRAIAAIDARTYGVCTVCNRCIPFERFESLPATQICVACPDEP